MHRSPTIPPDAQPPRARHGVALVAATALLALAGTTTLAAVTLDADPAAAAGTCEADFDVNNQWDGGFGTNVAVTNTGDPVTSWEVTWEFSGDQQVTQLWNGTVSQSGNTVHVASLPWNGAVGTGGTLSFGFNGSGDGSTATPTAVTLNGAACSTGTDPTPTPTTTTPTPTPTETTPTPTPTETTDPPAADGDLYVDTGNQAYPAWSAASGDDKALLAKIALTPQAYWVGNWDDPEHAQAEVQDYTGRAVAAGQVPQLVIYAIPGRDCGSYSGGGVAESEYADWIDTMAAGIQGNPLVVLEPDALAQLGDCDGQGDRVGYLAYAASSLTDAGAHVYVDAGHSGWLAPSTAADRLLQVGLDDAVGFAVNTSNYQTTADSRAWAEQVSALTGGAGYVIDTSRNGNGSNGQWCNPSGRALGDRPSLVDDSTNLDALLWVKLPGESDGTCNGGPSAGAWWQSMALELARNASW
ncbi:glycoside hydrolase family 6 protein [Paraoerskovia marina]|uniref:glycoside hydrolase family 6 protein n=1 Tax=Paraoerskovia marina TaxID=545619 RepID=UPI0009DD79F7|nr:glycoside hydrolase family 6 protein [Paraoerskovia marina]